ncbi:MAG: hypothetical protein ABR589_12400 [Chthoniobacterales bacterium]
MNTLLNDIRYAQRRDVFALVIARASKLVAINLVLAAASSRALRAMLYNVAALDVSTFAFVNRASGRCVARQLHPRAPGNESRPDDRPRTRSMMKAANDSPGSARVSRAGEGVPPSRSLSFATRRPQEACFRGDAKTSTRDACATQA